MRLIRYAHTIEGEARLHVIRRRVPQVIGQIIRTERGSGRITKRDIYEVMGGITGISMTDFLEDALLNEVFRNTGYTPVATVYSALHTASPGETAGTGSEISGNAYARQSMAFGAPSGGIISNSADVTFPIATPSAQGTATDGAINDASTTGNRLAYGQLTASKTIGAGDQFIFRSGQVSIQFD